LLQPLTARVITVLFLVTPSFNVTWAELITGIIDASAD
jgi:hypothetical protein